MMSHISRMCSRRSSGRPLSGAAKRRGGAAPSGDERSSPQAESDSSHGSDMATPAPRRTVRRESRKRWAVMGGFSWREIARWLGLQYMLYDLSPQTEQYLASMVAGGLYPSKEAAIEAAVAALREKSEAIPVVREDHLEFVEQGIASADAGRLRPFAADDWLRLRQLARS